jgi:hypothetical protein
VEERHEVFRPDPVEQTGKVIFTINTNFVSSDMNSVGRQK